MAESNKLDDSMAESWGLAEWKKGMLKNHNYRTSKDVLIAPLS